MAGDLVPCDGLERTTRRVEVARVAQQLSATAVAAFPELAVMDTPAGTVLFGYVRDDAELHGIRSRLQLLGLTILDVHRLPD